MDTDRLMALLQAYQGDAVFNQYRDIHPELDWPDGAAIRRRNLDRYLHCFRRAAYLLVGEAAGYAGCRFSGIPFTCESQLAGAARLGWTRGQGLARSSTAATPWVERSATAVWQAFDGRRDCLLWNAFPWHPFGPAGSLSNRNPGWDLADGLGVLEEVLSLFPEARPVAVGRVSQRALRVVGVEAPYLRHPSHGGQRRFAAGVAALPRLDRTSAQPARPEEGGELR